MAWYRKGKKSWRYGKRSSVKRRARANQRAAANQRDSLTIAIKYSSPYDFTAENAATSLTRYVNMYSVLANAPMYAAFASMYDQVKIESATVSVNQMWSNPTYQNVANPMQICTAWDRTGISYDPITGTVQKVDFDSVAQASSAFVKPALYGTLYKCTRKIYPSTMEEKGQYVPTAMLNSGAAQLLDSPTSDNETGAYKFKPTFEMSIKPNGNGIAKNDSVGKFMFDYTIIVTFRGLRKLQTYQ